MVGLSHNRLGLSPSRNQGLTPLPLQAEHDPGGRINGAPAGLSLGGLVRPS